MTEQEQLAKQVTEELFNKGNTDLVDQVYHSRLRYTQPGQGILTRDGLKAWVRELHRGFPDMHMEVLGVVAEGDRTVNHWRFTGTHTGEFLGIPPTNKRVDFEGLTLNRMDGQQIVESLSEYDTLGAFQTVGVVPDLGLKRVGGTTAEARA